MMGLALMLTEPRSKYVITTTGPATFRAEPGGRWTLYATARREIEDDTIRDVVERVEVECTEGIRWLPGNGGQWSIDGPVHRRMIGEIRAEHSGEFVVDLSGLTMQGFGYEAWKMRFHPLWGSLFAGFGIFVGGLSMILGISIRMLLHGVDGLTLIGD
jgi:hypothetical protein